MTAETKSFPWLDEWKHRQAVEAQIRYTNLKIAAMHLLDSSASTKGSTGTATGIKLGELDLEEGSALYQFLQYCELLPETSPNHIVTIEKSGGQEFDIAISIHSLDNVTSPAIFFHLSEAPLTSAFEIEFSDSVLEELNQELMSQPRFILMYFLVNAVRSSIVKGATPLQLAEM